MYRYESSILRERGLNSPYVSVDLTKVKMQELYDNYQDGFIELSEPSLTKHVWVNLNDLRQQTLPFTNVLFPSWLATIGNKTIFGSTIVPRLIEKEIRASDAIQAGFDIRLSHPRDPFGDGPYPSADLRDAYIEKRVPQLDLIQKRVLTTVNGLVHINIPGSRGLIVKEAGRSLSIEGDNHIGIISFENIGDIQQVKIKEDMVLPSNPAMDTTHREAFYIDIGKELKGKSVLFVFCGRIYNQPDIVQRVNDQGVMKINLYKLDILQLILESKAKIDLSSLKLDERIYKKGAVNIKEIINDEVIMAMLLLMQSFFVIVDAPRLLMERRAITQPKLPGILESTNPVTLPYVTSSGILYPYWKITHKAHYHTLRRLHLKDTFYRFPLYRTNGLNEGEEWVNNLNEYHKVTYETGHLLSIRSQYLVQEA